MSQLSVSIDGGPFVDVERVKVQHSTDGADLRYNFAEDNLVIEAIDGGQVVGKLGEDLVEVWEGIAE